VFTIAHHRLIDAPASSRRGPATPRRTTGSTTRGAVSSFEDEALASLGVAELDRCCAPAPRPA
jgi:hypothetical protein